MAVNVWRTFISKPKLDNSVSPIAEVGYSHFGPTFAIAGTLCAENAIVLVNNICLQNTHQETKNSHFMNWFAFRPANHVMGNFSELNLTMTSRFTITQKKSYPYNILFIDNDRFAEMKPLLKTIKDSWEEALQIATQKSLSINTEILFDEFKKLKLVTDATERLKETGYWHPGHYQTKIRVTTDNPKQIFDLKKSFILKPSDLEALGENAEKIIASICQQPQSNYHCATPALISKK